MTKLDEIEARAKAPAAWADERRRIDCELLIRAVRELGAVADWADFVAVECESGVIETECDEAGEKLSRAHHDRRIAKGIRRHWNEISPDVLALLEGLGE